MCRSGWRGIANHHRSTLCLLSGAYPPGYRRGERCGCCRFPSRLRTHSPCSFEKRHQLPESGRRIGLGEGLRGTSWHLQWRTTSRDGAGLWVVVGTWAVGMLIGLGFIGQPRQAAGWPRGCVPVMARDPHQSRLNKSSESYMRSQLACVMLFRDTDRGHSGAMKRAVVRVTG